MTSDDVAPSDSARSVHIWVNPPETSVPLTRGPFRFAIATPAGPSTNSWRTWVRGSNAYVACRDNFQGFKVSLHASAIWRLGFSDRFAQTRPDIIPRGQDRVLKKWRPDPDLSKGAVIAFQIMALDEALYLNRDQRATWHSNIIFVEPPVETSSVATVSVVVAHGDQPVVFSNVRQDATLGVLPLGKDRTLQVVATYEKVGDMRRLIAEALTQAAVQNRTRGMPADGGVLLIHGERGGKIPWICAVKLRPV